MPYLIWFALLLLVGVALVIRSLLAKARKKLQKAGVQLSFGHVGFNGVSRLAVATQGALARLECASIAVGWAAGGGPANADRGAGVPAPWLPIAVRGLRLTIAPKASRAGTGGRKRQRKAPKPDGVGAGVARAAAALPVAAGLQLAGKVLPRVPVAVEDVTIDLQGPGLTLHLQQATASFAAASGQQLQVTLLAQHFSLRPAAVGGNGGDGDGAPEQQQPGVACPAVQIVCAVGPNRGLLPIAITLADVRIGEITVRSASELIVALARGGTPAAAAAAPAAVTPAVAPAQAAAASGALHAKPSKPPPDFVRLLQLLPTKGKLALAGVRLDNSSKGMDAPAGLPAFGGHVGALQVSLSSAPGQVVGLGAPPDGESAAAGKVAVAAVSLGAVQLWASGSGGSSTAAADKGAAGVQAAVPAAATAAWTVTLDKVALAGELARDAAAAAPARRGRLRVNLQASCSLELHKPRSLVREPRLPLLVASLRQLKAQVAAAKAAKARAAAELARRRQHTPAGTPLPPALSLGRDGSGWEASGLLPSPASSVASVSALPSVTSATAPMDEALAAAATPVPPAALPGVAGATSSDAPAAPALPVECRWSAKLAAPGGLNVELADAAGEVCHWLSLEAIDGAGSGRTAPGVPPRLEASVAARRLAVRSRVAAGAATLGARMQQLLALDTVEGCISSIESGDAAEGEAGAAAAAAAAVPTLLLASASLGNLEVPLTQARVEPLLALAASLAALAPPKRPKPAAAASDVAASAAAAAAAPRKARKPKAFKLASCGAALQALRVSYTAPLAVVDEFASAAAAAATSSASPAAPLRPPCDPGEALVSVELLASGLQIAALQAPQKVFAASVQLLSLESRTTCRAAPPGAPPLQSYRLLLVAGLDARLHDRPDNRLLKLGCQQVHAHAHVDAILGPLGAVTTLLMAAGATMRRAAEARAAAAAAAGAPAASPLPSPRGAMPSPTAAESPGAAAGALRSPGVSPRPALEQQPSGPAMATPFAARPPRPSVGGQQTEKSLGGRKRRPLQLEARLRDVYARVDICESDSVFVRVSLLKASSALEQTVLERLAVGMNEKDVLTVSHGSIGLLRAPLSASAAGAAVGSTSGHQQQQQQAAEAWSPGRDSLAPSPDRGVGLPPPALQQRSPSAQARGAGASAPTLLSEAARIYEDGGTQGDAFVNDALASNSLGARKPSAARDPGSQRRQEARQAAARERCVVPDGIRYLGPPRDGEATAAAGGGPGAHATAASSAEAAAATAAGGILSLDVHAEVAIFSVPHDQSVGRLIIVAETWSKAVKQVSRAHGAALRAAIAGLKPAPPAGPASPAPAARAAKPKRPKLAFVELVADINQVVFALEQHPLEQWMALHGPALQAIAAQRHLSEQLVGSVAVSKRGSRCGRGSGSGDGTGAAAATAAAAAAIPGHGVPPGGVPPSPVPPSLAAAAAAGGGEEASVAGDSVAPREDSVTARAGGAADGLSADEDSSDDEGAGILSRDSLTAALPGSSSVALATLSVVPGASAAAPQQAGGHEQREEFDLAMTQMHRDLAAMYKARCAEIEATTRDPLHHRAALMHVAVERAEAVVVICLPSSHNDAVAISNIARLDAGSRGVVIERVQPISIDAGLSDMTVHFGGAEAMAASVGSIGVSGFLIRARQAAAPPQFTAARYRVGAWHEADVPVVVKGTRPPMKMYTDLRAELDGAQGGYCPGLEAAFGQLNAGFKRIIVPNSILPDGSIPPAPPPGTRAAVPLPWWDMMRYMWRGTATVRVRGLTAVMAITETPHVGPEDPRLVLTASTIGLTFVAGRLDLTATHMTAVAHGSGPDCGKGEPLLLLPAFHIPLVNLAFRITPDLPGGRDPSSHHVFPLLEEPPPPGAVQEFVDVFSEMRCIGWSLGIDIAVSSDRTAQELGRPRSNRQAGSPGGSPPARQQQGASRLFRPLRVPHVYIGEFQIKYIIDLVEVLALPSVIVRACRKLKPWYGPASSDWHVALSGRAIPSASAAAARAGVVPMALLKRQVDVSLTADTFWVHHDAQDAADPSDMVYVTMSSLRYTNSFTYSRTVRVVPRSNGVPRSKDSMRQYMTSLAVEAYELRMVKPSEEFGAPQGNTGSRKEQSDRLRDLLSEPRTPRGTGGSGTPPSARGGAAEAEPDFASGLIVSAACFLLKQAPPESGGGASSGGGAGPGSGGGAAAAAGGAVAPDPPKRPIRMIAQDVRIFCPAELRDTLVLLFVHMGQSFGGISFGQGSGPRRVRTGKPARDDGAAGAAAAAAGADAGGRGPGAAAAAGGAAGASGADGRGAGAAAGGGRSSTEGGAPAAGEGGTGSTTAADEAALLTQLLVQKAARAAAEAARRSAGSSAASHDGDGGPPTADSPTGSPRSGAAGASPRGGAAAAASSLLGTAAAGGMSWNTCLLEYEIEFVQVQVNLVSEGEGGAPGSLVLGTNSAALVGHLYPVRRERTITFKMDQVQAHVVQSDVDPTRGPVWLEISNGKLAIPPGAENMMRQVLMPFRCHLVSTKTGATLPPGMAAAGPAPPTAAALGPATLRGAPGGGSGGGAGDMDGSGGGGGSFSAPARAQQELLVEVPRIEAHLDSRQFEILMDVIQNTFMAPIPQLPPSIRRLWSNPDAISDDDDSRDVLFALETIQSLRERLRCLQHEEVALRTALPHWMRAQLALTDPLLVLTGGAGGAAGDAAAGGGGLGGFGGSSGALCRIPDDSERHADLQSATEALAAALAITARGGGGGGPGGAAAALAPPPFSQPGWGGPGSVLGSHADVVLRWCREQIQGARDSIEATSAVLRLLRQEAALLRVRPRASMAVSCRVRSINWALSKGATTLVQGDLQDISYQSVRDRDHTGTTKIQLGTATFIDPAAAKRGGPSHRRASAGGLMDAFTSAAAAAASVDDAGGDFGPGVVLAAWNPDVSWEDEQLVRIYAIHGALEARAVVYEHIEVLVHPITIRLTSALAAALQDYFQLRDEDAKMARQGEYARSIMPPKPGAGGQAASAPTSAGGAYEGGTGGGAGGLMGGGGGSEGGGLQLGRRRSGEPSPVSGSAGSAGRRPLFARRQAALGAAAAREDGSASAGGGAGGGSGRHEGPAIQLPSGEWDGGAPTAASGGSFLWSPSTEGAPSEADSYAATSYRGRSPAPSIASLSAFAANAGGTPSLMSGSFTGSAGGGGPSRLRGGPGGGGEEGTGVRYGALAKARRAASLPPTPKTDTAAAAAAAAAAATSKRLAVRALRFKHVRVNRLCARITFEGPPITIHDFGLVLDNRVYRNLEGGWRTVLNRYKWDLVKSILKSATGLQARKLAELNIPTLASGDDITSAAVLALRPSGGGFKANLRSLLRAGKPGRGSRALAEAAAAMRAGGGAGGRGELRALSGGGAAAGGASGDEEEDGGLGGSTGGGGSIAGALTAGAEDFEELMRDAVRQKQRQQKVALLLGAVPPLPGAGPYIAAAAAGGGSATSAGLAGGGVSATAARSVGGAAGPSPLWLGAVGGGSGRSSGGGGGLATVSVDSADAAP